MNKKVIFEKIYHFSGTLYSLLFFAILGLSSVASQYNFNLPKTAQVRDAAPALTSLAQAEKLSISSILQASATQAKSQSSSQAESQAELPAGNQADNLAATSSTPAIAETAVSVTPPAVASSFVPRRLASSSSFSIVNPTPTSDRSYISPTESGVRVYNDSFFFAHSTLAFNWIKSLGEGGTFTISRNGTTETYRVAKKVTLSMNGELNGLRPVSAYYDAISSRRQFLGKTYDIVLMTCGDGTYGANGNNSAFRTFIFAYRA